MKIALFLAGGALAAALAAAVPLSYPPAPTDGTVDDYYGTKVPDPYRPLEDIEAPATQTWLQAESSLARSYLDAIPERAAIRAHLKATANYEYWTAPYRVGNRYFYWHNTGTQNQSVLFTSIGVRGTPHALLDPNTMSKDGAVTAGDEAPSWDGHLLAYALQTSGSDWQTWRVRDVRTGRDLRDVVRWSKFSSASWLADDSGFVYGRYPMPKAGEAYKGALTGFALYLHKLGSPQSADTVVFYRSEHPNWLYGGGLTEDRRYFLLYQSSNDSTFNRVGYLDLSGRGIAFHPVFWKADASWNCFDNSGPTFYCTTNLNAPNGRVVAVDVRNPTAPRTIIPEAANALSSPAAAGGRLFLTYLIDAHTTVKEFERDGRLVRTVVLPGLGTASGFGGWHDDRQTFYSYTGYTEPLAIYTYDLATGKSAPFRRPAIPFDAAQYETEEVFYKSKDGTRIPLFISHRKGMVLDGSNPTILYGYGGFRYAETPHLEGVTWLQMGGIYARACIRGGSEYGRLGIKPECWGTSSGFSTISSPLPNI